MQLRSLDSLTYFSFQFLYWIKPKPGEQRVEQFETTHSPYITVELRPFTEYHFSVLVFNNAGDGPVSNEVGPIRTPEGSKYNFFSNIFIPFID